MKNIREEIQTWLELVARVVGNIPFDKEIDWGDIESVYNGEHSAAQTPIFKAFNEELSFETVYCDAISIDHMHSEILDEDFGLAMGILKRYKGIILS